MRKILCLPLLISFYFLQAQTPEQLEAQKVMLPNGWSLTPVGKSFPLGDLPLNMAVSKSKKYIAVTNNGQSVQTLQLVDAKKEEVLDNVIIPRSWLGLKFSEDEKFLYAAGGTDNWILKYAVNNSKLQRVDSIALGARWPHKIWPTGIELDDKKGLLYAVTKDNKKLYIVNLKSKLVTDSFSLEAEGYACMLSPNRKELYISCWGCDKILVFDAEGRKFTAEIPVGDNPNDFCLSKNGKYLYVANANDNSVSVVDVKQRKQVEVLNAALFADAPNGSTTNAVALSPDEKTLYIANADNNCLAVFDVSNPGVSLPKGFIPTGWYPTNVKVIGKKIFVANGKGFSSMANPYGPNPIRKRGEVIYQMGDTSRRQQEQYIAGLFKGTMSVIDIPNEQQLSAYSQQVYKNTPYSKEKESLAQGQEGNPVPSKPGGSSPIKHVFYIIKENRTYDQVLGDMKEGNGDSSLCVFPERIMPNHHALAREFVLLDNFYVNAEVSADGHNWSMAAYATDYVEKTWPTSYGGRGGTYDFEGQGKTGRPRSGYIWDHCNKYGVSYRTYGEFADDGKPNIPVLAGHVSPSYTGWNLAVRDTLRIGQWKKEFDSLVAVNALPSFNTVRIGNDHTEGLRVGRPTPYAHVADNDLALGMFIEHLSKSPVWNESAVFVIEDDAQNGADHVDAHRSIAFIAGGFVKRGFVDHTMYSTSSMLRTMELILGMPPMSQYDAAATPMWNCFALQPNSKPYKALPNNIPFTDKNTAVNQWSERSAKFDLTKEDAVPDLEFNEVLWSGLKGTPFPGPRRAAFVKRKKAVKDDDDD
ncbi:MAG: bifunctional YncE family protein/alkaline phosphatase family protein [Williamsia sp.]|nr:bifunctional YncE family protein/alkaline phosphatase family protein [Williamsia sp.]